MYTYILTQERMIQKGFVEHPIHSISQLSVASYVKKDIHVLLSQWNIPLEQLQERCHLCREALTATDINPWNTYFVVCADDSCSLEDSFLFERDASFLRKYVIRSADDLSRVPFLDNTAVRDVLVDRSYLETQDELIQELMKVIEASGGLNGELKENDVQRAVSVVMSHLEAKSDEA